MSIVLPGLDVETTAGGAGVYGRRAVRVGTTVAGTLATSFAAGQVVDGITLVLGDRIVLKNQATQTENGIYIVTAGTPIRSDDFYTGDFVAGVAVVMLEGTVQGDTGWICTSPPGADLVGTDAITFKQTSGTGVDGDVITNATQTLSNKSLVDASTWIIGNVDPTKRAVFDVSGITTGTTRTFTMPDASTTLVGTNTTQTLTNKTLTLPVISQISNGGGTISVPSVTTTLVGTNTSDTLTNKVLTNGVNVFADGTDNTKRLTFNTSAQATGTTLTIATGAITGNQQINIPAIGSTDVFVTENFVQTLTNKTLSGPTIAGGTINGTTVGATTAATGRFTTLSAIATSNQLALGTGTAVLTITNAQASNQTITIPAITGPDTVVTQAFTQTLTNKTLTSPVISGGTIDNATVGATTASTGRFTTLTATTSTTTPTMSATNTTNQVTLGTTNIMTISAPQTGGSATLTLPSLGAVADSVTYQSQAQNLSNKTITLGSINNTPIGGTTASTGRFTTVTATAAANQAVLGTGTGALTITSGQSTAQTLTLPNITGADTAMTLALAQTVTGVKTFSASPVISTITNTGTLTLPTTTDTLVGRATTDTLTNKTLTAPVINGGTIDNAAIGSTTASTGRFTTITATAASNQAVLGTGTGALTITSGQSTAQTLTLPNITAPDTVETLGLAQTITGVKTFSTAPVISTITNTGTLTLPTTTDTLVGRATTDTLTNKTLTAPVINGGTIDNASIGATTASTGRFTTVTATAGTNQLVLGTSNPVTLNTGTQTVGATTLAIPDLAGVSDTIVTTLASQTVRNKNLLSGNVQTYSVGTVSQSGTAITGVGTTFTAAMTNGYILYSTGQTTTIRFSSATALVASNSLTVASTTYTIFYGGPYIFGTGITSYLEVPNIAGPTFTSLSDKTRKITFDYTNLATNSTILLSPTNSTSSTKVINFPDCTSGDTVITTTFAQTLTNKTITDTTNNVTANSLRTATGSVSVAAATAPTTGQVLTATGGSTATWQTPSNSGNLIDNATFIVDATDPTIRLGFDMTGTAGTTLTLKTQQTTTQTATVPNIPYADTFLMSETEQPEYRKTVVAGSELVGPIYGVFVGSTINTGLTSNAPSFSNDSLTYYISNQTTSGSIYRYDVLTNTLSAPLNTGSVVVGTCISPDNSLLFSANFGAGTMRAINIPALTISSTITLAGNPRDPILSADSAQIYVACGGSTVYRVNINTLAPTVFGAATPALVSAINAFGERSNTRVYVTDVGAAIVPYFNTSGVFQGNFSTPGNASYGCADPTRDVIYISIGTNIYSYSSITHTLLNTYTIGTSGLFNIRVTTDGNYLYAISAAGSNFYAINLNTNAITSYATSGNPASPISLSIRPDNKRIVIGGTNSAQYDVEGTTYTAYAVGKASQSGVTITGVGTFWTSQMIGGTIIFADGTASDITNINEGSPTTITTSVVRTVSSQYYTIYYGTSVINIAGNGILGDNTRLIRPIIIDSSDYTKKMGFDLTGSAGGTSLTLLTNQVGNASLSIPAITTSDTIMTLGTNQTVTGTKTLTSPVITSPSITGTISGSPAISTPAITGGTISGSAISTGSIDNTPIGATTASTGRFTTLSAVSTGSKVITFDASPATAGTTLTIVSNQTTSQSISVPNVTSGQSFVTTAATQTLTNKTLTNALITSDDGTDPTLTSTLPIIYSNVIASGGVAISGSKATLAFVEDSSRWWNTELQTSFASRGVSIAQANGVNTTFGVTGMLFVTTGTAALGSFNSTSLAASSKRVRTSTAAAAASSAYFSCVTGNTSSLCWFAGSGTGPGGYLFIAKFSFDTTNPPLSDTKIFVGMAASGLPNANAGPSVTATNNSLGFYAENTSTNFGFFVNNTGATSVATSSIPKVDTSSLFEARIYVPRTSPTTAYYCLTKYTGTTITRFQGSSGAVNTTLTAPLIWVSSSGTATAVNICCSTVYLETFV